MGNALIKLEKSLYASQANDVMFAPFKLVDRKETGENVVVLTFEPADETPMTESKGVSTSPSLFPHVMVCARHASTPCCPAKRTSAASV